MPGEQLREIISRHAKASLAIRKHGVRLAVRRGIVRAAEEECQRNSVAFRGRRNFLYARGYGRGAVLAVNEADRVGPSSSSAWVPLSVDAQPALAASSSSLSANALAPLQRELSEVPTMLQRFLHGSSARSTKRLRGARQVSARQARSDKELQRLSDRLDARIAALHEVVKDVLRLQLSA